MKPDQLIIGYKPGQSDLLYWSESPKPPKSGREYAFSSQLSVHSCLLQYSMNSGCFVSSVCSCISTVTTSCWPCLYHVTWRHHHPRRDEAACGDIERERGWMRDCERGCIYEYQHRPPRLASPWWWKDSATDDELAAVETGSRSRLAETWSRGLWITTPGRQYDSSVPASGVDDSGGHVVRLGDVAARCLRGGSECRPVRSSSSQPSTGKLPACTSYLCHVLRCSWW